MSSRNFRRICGNDLPPPASSDSDNDFAPIVQKTKNTYEGLEVGSDSETENEIVAAKNNEAEIEVEAVPGGARKKTNNRKKKKKGKKGKAGPSQELDEIDKSIMEINALLGEPEPAKPKETPNPIKHVLAVQAKYLNIENEVRRLFGPDDPEDVRQRIKTQPYRARLLKRIMVRPTNETKVYNFKKTGLSMSIEKRVGDVTYFVFDHDIHYQKMQQTFLIKYAKSFMRPGAPLLSMEDARKFMHVEPLLEIADRLFRIDEHGLGNEIVENIVTFLQFVAHPSFNLASENVRLTYNYIENRPFHVAMLKYMYLLTNKACHRTALEIAKMLINIDPSDPLAVLFVIDTIALRAREHQWLVDAINYFNRERQAGMLINIQFSFALAQFHVAIKNKTSTIDADRNLRHAIMSNPEVVVELMKCANISQPRVLNHTFFTHSSANTSMKELIMIYAKLCWPRWREPKVLDWFIKSAVDFCDNYDNNLDIRESVKALAVMRSNLFQSTPIEIVRHLSCIRAMSNLLIDTNLGESLVPSAWNPNFEAGTNRYSYTTARDPRLQNPNTRPLLFEFFTSLLPHLDPQEDDDE